MKQRTELHTFTVEDLEVLAKWEARVQIIGPMFIGNLGEQTIVWNGDILEVRTHVTELEPGERH